MNPYQPPSAPREPGRRGSDPRAVRRRKELLPIEGRVRGIAIVVGVAGLGHAVALTTRASSLVVDVAQSAYHLLGAALCLTAAVLLFRRRAPGRAALTAWFVAGLTVAVLLWAAFRALPIKFVLVRAAMMAGILGYLHYHEGATVLGEEHRRLLEETSEIEAPVSSWTVVALVALAFAINLVVG